jgi:hypothetical protein
MAWTAKAAKAAAEAAWTMAWTAKAAKAAFEAAWAVRAAGAETMAKRELRLDKIAKRAIADEKAYEGALE